MKVQRRQWILSAIGIAVMAVIGQWWVQWPHRTAEEFVGLMSRAEFTDTAALLAAPSSIEVAEGGGVRLRDEQGDVSLIPLGRLPFLAAGLEGEDRSRSWLDVLLARDRVGLAATGAGQPGPREGDAHFFDLAIERGRIKIDRVDSLLEK